MNEAVDWFQKAVGIAGLIDIAIMTALLYSVLVWLRRTKRAASVLSGILIVALVFLLARQFNLYLTSAVLQGFFAVFLVALVVIFQEELRYFFEQIARWSFTRRLPWIGKPIVRPPKEHLEILVRTLTDLARERTGALVVLRGKDLIIRHLEGGNDLRGEISEEILKSIFDPHSIGHDGAVILEGTILSRFGCHLPLSRSLSKLKRGGTRHAAALGLSELTDAL